MRIRLEALDLAETALLDGGTVNQLFRTHALRCARDSADRPGEKKARTVYFTMTVKPVLNPRGELAYVDVAFDCRSKLPDHKTPTYQMKADPDLGLLYNPNAPDALHQLTFDDFETDGDYNTADPTPANEQPPTA